jgi:hypothetical protein
MKNINSFLSKNIKSTIKSIKTKNSPEQFILDNSKNIKSKVSNGNSNSGNNINNLNNININNPNNHNLLLVKQNFENMLKRKIMKI